MPNFAYASDSSTHIMVHLPHLSTHENKDKALRLAILGLCFLQ